MKRRKLPQLKYSLTFQGLSPGDILMSGLSFYLGYRLGGMISGHPVIKIAMGAAMVALALPRVKAWFNRYPPGWFNHWLKWLPTKDIYYPLPDETVMPIISYDMKDDEANRTELRGEAGFNGEHP